MHEMLQEICDVCEDTVVLGAETGIHQQYIHVVAGTHPLRYDLQPEATRYLLESNAGRILLFMKIDEQIDLIITKTHLARALPSVSRRSLHDMIDKIRRDGYSFEPDMVVPGASVIAVPLKPGAVKRPLTIGIAGPTQRLRVHLSQNVEILMRAKSKYLA